MLQKNFEFLHSKNSEWLQKENINGDFRRRVFIQDDAAQKEKRFSHGNAGRMDDP